MSWLVSILVAVVAGGRSAVAAHPGRLAGLGSGWARPCARSPLRTHGASPQGRSVLGMEDAQRVDGRWVVPGAVWVGAYENGKAVFASRGNFSVWHRGTPVLIAGTEVMTSVATLPGPPNALLVGVAPSDRPVSCHLISLDGEVVRTTEIGRCQLSLTADLITDNQASYQVYPSGEAMVAAITELLTDYASPETSAIPKAD